MTIKDDEIELVRFILKWCKKPYDMLPTVGIFDLDIPPKRILYLLNKMTHFIEYGVNVYLGWIDQDPSYIRDYYKNVHGVEL
jgi:hypothetical protein